MNFKENVLFYYGVVGNSLAIIWKAKLYLQLVSEVLSCLRLKCCSYENLPTSDNPKQKKIITSLCLAEYSERHTAKNADTMDFCLDHSFFSMHRLLLPGRRIHEPGSGSEKSGSLVIFPVPRHPVSKQAVSDKERGNAGFLWWEILSPQQSKVR